MGLPSANGPRKENMRRPTKLDPIVLTLREMASVLKANGHTGQGEYVAALATIGEWDQGAMIPGLCSGAMWGGAGAVWEVGEFASHEEKRSFWSLVIRLAGEMRSAEIRTQVADDIAAILREWVAKGI